MKKSKSKQLREYCKGDPTVVIRKVLIPQNLRETIEEIEDEITGIQYNENFVGANNAAQMLTEALQEPVVRLAIIEYVEREVLK